MKREREREIMEVASYRKSRDVEHLRTENVRYS